MYRLAKKDHRVIFVDPPINMGRLWFRQLKRGEWSLKRLISQQKTDKSGTLIYTPINPLPFPGLTSRWHINKINSIAKKWSLEKRKTILWVYHVQIVNLEKYLRGINYDVLIYDCVDNYAAFPEQGGPFSTNISRDKLIEQEKKLTETANLVFASAPGLVERLRKLNPNVYYTPNVGDYKRFKNAKSYKYKIPEDLSRIPRPRIGMIGAMDEYKFDALLVKKCALENPKYSFVLIGPLALKDREASLDSLGLAGIENIHYLGSRPYEEKKYYMAGFDAEIIPYQLNDYTVGGCFPVKFHDSLAAGLPVVVTDLPAYAPFDNVCYISKTYDDFSRNLRRALEEDNPKRLKERQEVARINDWDNKVDAMLGYVDAHFV